MAVDSAQKRQSLLGLLTVDGTIDYSDRLTLLGLYGGIGAPGTYEVSVTDGLKLGELVVSIGEYNAAATDGLKLGDLAGAVAKYIYIDSVTDGLKLGDLIVGDVSGIEEASVLDGIRFGETVSAAAEYSAALVDGLKFGDLISETEKYIYDVSVTDGLKLGDLASEIAKYIYDVSVTEGLKLGDLTRGILEQQLATVLDGIKFGEYGSATISVPTFARIAKRPTELRFIFKTQLGNKGLRFH